MKIQTNNWYLCGLEPIHKIVRLVIILCKLIKFSMNKMILLSREPFGEILNLWNLEQLYLTPPYQDFHQWGRWTIEKCFRKWKANKINKTFLVCLAILMLNLCKIMIPHLNSNGQNIKIGKIHNHIMFWWIKITQLCQNRKMKSTQMLCNIRIFKYFKNFIKETVNKVKKESEKFWRNAIILKGLLCVLMSVLMGSWEKQYNI